MKKPNFICILVLLLFFSGCIKEQSKTFTIETILVDSTSIRAIEAVDENTLWFSGSNGQVGFTKDGGKTFSMDTISYDTLKPEFRSITVRDSVIHILSIASPALLYRSENNGQSWKIVYQEDDPGAFYNAMTISDSGLGVAVGDPIEECLSVLITKNGGNSWSKLSCDALPMTVNGEAGFAASNSNVNIFGDNVWLVSGGSRARVFHSENRGESWKVYNTPIIQGGQMTGIFTSHFYDASKGIIMGGDWSKKEQKTQNKAITIDSGKTWTLVADGKGPGYRSSVRYIPGTKGKELIAVGTPGISYSKDGGKNWEKISEEGFYTIRFTKDGKMAWLAGANKVGKLIVR